MMPAHRLKRWEKIDWKPALDRSVVDQYKNLVSIEKICAKAGVSRSALYRRLGELGIGKRRRGKASFYRRQIRGFEHAHPICRLIFKEANRQFATYSEMETRSGVNRATISGWRNHSSPLLINVEAVANALDMKLKLVAIDQ